MLLPVEGDGLAIVHLREQIDVALVLCATHDEWKVELSVER